MGWIPRWCGPISTPLVRGVARLGARPATGPLTRADADGREALGKSRGGWTTKIHLDADRRCRPVSRATSPGQRHDSTMFQAVLAGIRIRHAHPGRPRTRPGWLLADKAYSTRAIRSWSRHRGIRAIIPQRADQIRNRTARGSHGGCPPAWDSTQYQQRNIVERCANKLKGFRAIATRYDKRDYVYLGTIDTASIMIWLRDSLIHPQSTGHALTPLRPTLGIRRRPSASVTHRRRLRSKREQTAICCLKQHSVQERKPQVGIEPPLTC